MKKNTLIKMVEAIESFLYDTVNVKQLSKICVDFNTASEHGLMSSIHDCIYITTDYKEDVIIACNETEIYICRTVRENNYTVGYKFITFISTEKKTQIQITAELMYDIQYAIKECK